MIKYKQIFEEKIEFMIRHDMGVVRFRYQENDDLGEFVDQDGNIMAQLYEADKAKEWFVVSVMFMGEIVLKSISYFRLVTPEGAHVILTDKYRS
jgi:hypothetical protein